jgi:hypothetical protein
MSTTDHADLEALSAYVDGEAPEWADHVAGCEVCRAAAARLGAVAAAVRAPVDPPSDPVRDRAVTAALEEARHQAERQRFARRRSPRPWAMPAAAAAVVALLGLSGVILSANRTTDESTTLAGPALEDAKTEVGVAGAAPDAPPADLGDIGDPSTLRTRAGFPPLASAGAAASVGRSSSVANSGAADANTGAALSSPPNAVSGSSGVASGGASGVAPPTTTLSQRSGAPAVVGTRPCEERVRSRSPELGPVVYFATARRGDVPAYVLGFSPPTAPVILFLLSQSDCSELLRSAGP